MKKVTLLLDQEDNAYQEQLLQEARFQAIRLKLQLQGPRYANGSSFNQMDQLFDCTREESRPDAVLLIPAGRQSQERVCRRLVAAGISLVFLNRLPSYLDELRDENREVLVAGVAPDQAEIGRIQARQCARLMGAKGHVLLVTGTPESPSAMERKHGLEETLSPETTLHVVEGEWTEESGQQAVANWLRLVTHGEQPIDVVVCQNDQMARGVRRVLSDPAQAGRLAMTKTPVLGCDGLAHEGRRMVADGELAGTVVIPATSARALELLSAFWQVGSRASRDALAPDSFPPLDQLKLA